MNTQSTKLYELIKFVELDTNTLNSFITILNISLSKNINIFEILNYYLEYLLSIEDIISIFDKIKEFTYILFGVIKFINRFATSNYINTIRINIFNILFLRAKQLYIKALITSRYNFKNISTNSDEVTKSNNKSENKKRKNNLDNDTKYKKNKNNCSIYVYK